MKKGPTKTSGLRLRRPKTVILTSKQKSKSAKEAALLLLTGRGSLQLIDVRGLVDKTMPELVVKSPCGQIGCVCTDDDGKLHAHRGHPTENECFKRKHFLELMKTARPENEAVFQKMFFPKLELEVVV